jgi:hypothetical protein
MSIANAKEMTGAMLIGFENFAGLIIDAASVPVNVTWATDSSGKWQV